MMKSKIHFKGFCETQIKPFLTNDKEGELYNTFGKYLEGVNGTLDTKKGIFIRGVVGSGKTIMFKMAQRYPLTVQKIKMVNAETLSGNIEAGQSWERYMKSVWCFDDIGTEQKVNIYGKGVEAFKRIIEERYDKWKYQGLITHFTSNLSNEVILDRYGERAYDRLKEMCNVIKYPSNESKRGLSEVKPIEDLTQEKEPTEAEKEEIKNKYIQDYYYKPLQKSIEEGTNLVKDEYGTIYNYLLTNGEINPTDEEKINLYSKHRERFLRNTTIMNVPPLRRKEWDDFKGQKYHKSNYYHIECSLRAKQDIVGKYVETQLF